MPAFQEQFFFTTNEFIEKEIKRLRDMAGFYAKCQELRERLVQTFSEKFKEEIKQLDILLIPYAKINQYFQLTVDDYLKNVGLRMPKKEDSILTLAEKVMDFINVNSLFAILDLCRHANATRDILNRLLTKILDNLTKSPDEKNREVLQFDAMGRAFQYYLSFEGIGGAIENMVLQEKKAVTSGTKKDIEISEVNGEYALLCEMGALIKGIGINLATSINSQYKIDQDIIQQKSKKLNEFREMRNKLLHEIGPLKDKIKARYQEIDSMQIKEQSSSDEDNLILKQWIDQLAILQTEFKALDDHIHKETQNIAQVYLSSRGELVKIIERAHVLATQLHQKSKTVCPEHNRVYPTTDEAGTRLSDDLKTFKNKLAELLAAYKPPMMSSAAVAIDATKAPITKTASGTSVFASIFPVFGISSANSDNSGSPRKSSSSNLSARSRVTEGSPRKSSTPPTPTPMTDPDFLNALKNNKKFKDGAKEKKPKKEKEKEREKEKTTAPALQFRSSASNTHS